MDESQELNKIKSDIDEMEHYINIKLTCLLLASLFNSFGIIILSIAIILLKTH